MLTEFCSFPNSGGGRVAVCSEGGPQNFLGDKPSTDTYPNHAFDTWLGICDGGDVDFADDGTLWTTGRAANDLEFGIPRRWDATERVFKPISIEALGLQNIKNRKDVKLAGVSWSEFFLLHPGTDELWMFDQSLVTTNSPTSAPTALVPGAVVCVPRFWNPENDVHYGQPGCLEFGQDNDGNNWVGEYTWP